MTEVGGIRIVTSSLVYSSRRSSECSLHFVSRYKILKLRLRNCWNRHKMVAKCLRHLFIVGTGDLQTPFDSKGAGMPSVITESLTSDIRQQVRRGPKTGYQDKAPDLSQQLVNRSSRVWTDRTSALLSEPLVIHHAWRRLDVNGVLRL